VRRRRSSQQRDLLGKRHEFERRWRRYRGAGWSAQAAGRGLPWRIEQRNVCAARRIAASLISLAWAKPVISPDTPRRPKPGIASNSRRS
jgi:hypothetical protein